MAIKYVDDFEFPSEAGFHGSRGGTTQVKSHSRRVPGTHEKLRDHGERMGFKYGGAVKNTSSEFVQKHSKQDSMDNANMKRSRKDAADQRTKEMGNQPEVQPEFKKGGKAKKKHEPVELTESAKRKLKASKKKDAVSKHKRRRRSALDIAKKATKAEGGYMDSGKGMPKDVKSKGGKTRTPYKGYNEQAGGGGNEDDRYMSKSGGKAKKYKYGGMAHGEHVGGPHPEKEYPKSKANQKMPKNVKAKGGKMKYAEGGALKAAKKVMNQHVKAAPPKGHGVKGGLRKGGTMNYGKGGYRGGGKPAHRSTPMIGA